jgi:hypothetical protein
LKTVASLIGQIHSQLRFTAAACEFSLKTPGGILHIKTSGQEQLSLCRALQQGEQVYVLGQPRSFFNRRCHNHHVYFEAITLLPVEPSARFEQLLTTLIIGALTPQDSSRE